VRKTTTTKSPDQPLNARTEIESLVYRYADCVDTGDFAGVAELFANGRLVAPDGLVLAAGYDGMLAFCRDTLRLYPETNTPLTQHVMSNLVLDVDDDNGKATGRCNYTVFQKTDELPLQPIITGRYRDTFVRSDRSWQFLERQTLPQLVGDSSKHLLRFA